MRRVALIVILLAVWFCGVANAESWVLWKRFTEYKIPDLAQYQTEEPIEHPERGRHPWEILSAYPTYEKCMVKKKAVFNEGAGETILVNGKEPEEKRAAQTGNDNDWVFMLWSDRSPDEPPFVWDEKPGGTRTLRKNKPGATVMMWEWKCLPDTIDPRK
jgi:hypothetical protein